MQLEIQKYLFDIQTSIDSINEYLGDKRDFNHYQNNKLLRRGIERELEIIGEAVKKIPDEVKNEYKNVPWKEIVGMRDKLIHNYFGVNLEVVWKTITEDFPSVKDVFNDIYNKLE